MATTTKITRELLGRLGFAGAIAVYTGLAVLAAVCLTALLMWIVRGSVEPQSVGIAALVALLIAPVLSSYIFRLYFEMVRAESKLRSLVTFDDLTGTYNRRHFFSLAQRELARARRQNTPLSLIMVDIDHFKVINDRYGHLEGDRVLRAFAAACLEVVRPQDAMARFGGEEFVVLLPNTGLQEARYVAERLRQVALTVAPTSSGLHGEITISAGVASLSPHHESEFDALVRTADNALYKAKAAGRNRVEVASSEGPHEAENHRENGTV